MFADCKNRDYYKKKNLTGSIAKLGNATFL